jgi:hypothetical protein
VCGNVEDSPMIMSEKKRLIESTKPAFMNVARIPDAAPRCRGGTAFIIVVVFGAEKRPVNTPLQSTRAANNG